MKYVSIFLKMPVVITIVPCLPLQNISWGRCGLPCQWGLNGLSSQKHQQHHLRACYKCRFQAFPHIYSVQNLPLDQTSGGALPQLEVLSELYVVLDFVVYCICDCFIEYESQSRLALFIVQYAQKPSFCIILLSFVIQVDEEYKNPHTVDKSHGQTASYVGTVSIHFRKLDGRGKGKLQGSSTFLLQSP